VSRSDRSAGGGSNDRGPPAGRRNYHKRRGSSVEWRNRASGNRVKGDADGCKTSGGGSKDGYFRPPRPSGRKKNDEEALMHLENLGGGELGEEEAFFHSGTKGDSIGGNDLQKKRLRKALASLN